MKKYFICLIILIFNIYAKSGIILLPEYNFYESVVIDENEIDLSFDTSNKNPAYSIIFYTEFYEDFEFGIELTKQTTFLGPYFKENSNYIENLPLSLYLKMKMETENNNIFYYTGIIGYPILDEKALSVSETYTNSYGDTATVKGRFYGGCSYGYEFHFILFELGIKFTELEVVPINKNEPAHNYVNSKFFASIGIKL